MPAWLMTAELLSLTRTTRHSPEASLTTYFTTAPTNTSANADTKTKLRFSLFFFFFTQHLTIHNIPLKRLVSTYHFIQMLRPSSAPRMDFSLCRWDVNPSFSNPLWDSWINGDFKSNPQFSQNPFFVQINKTHDLSKVDWHPTEKLDDPGCKWKGYENLRKRNPDFLYCVPEYDYSDIHRDPRIYDRRNHWLIFMVLKDENQNLFLREPRDHLEMLTALNVRVLASKGQYGCLPALKEDQILIS